MEKIDKLYKDLTPVDSPEGTAVYVKNAVFDKYKQMFRNEQGTIKLGEVSTKSICIVIGVLPLDKGDLLVFSINYLTSNFDHLGQIGILDSNGNYTTIAEGEFTFSIAHPVDAEFKRNFKNERIVVFTDFYNPPRIINLDNYRFSNNTNLTKDQIKEFRLFRNYKVPNFGRAEVDDGGNLKTGVIYFFILYEDKDGNKSNVIDISQPVPIVDESKSEGYPQYDGSAGGKDAQKLVSFTLYGVDTDYKYLTVGAITKQSGVFNHYIFQTYSIASSQVEVLHTGFESKEEVSANYVLSNSATFNKAKTVTSSDKILYFGNVERFNVLDYQKYANNIKVNYTKKIVSRESVKPNYPNESSASLSWKSYKRGAMSQHERLVMPGEVYAVYVYFKMKDGSSSNAFHIPGRPPFDIYSPSPENIGFGGSENERVQEIINISNLNSSHYLHNDIKVDPDVKYFRTRDTSQNSNATNKGYSNCGFWENEDEFYPDTEEWEVYDRNGKKNLPSREKPRGNRVRHHKMPYYGDDAYEVFYNRSTEEVTLIQLELSDIYVPPHIQDQIQEVRVALAKRDTSNFTVSGQSILFPSANHAGRSYDNNNNRVGPLAGHGDSDPLIRSNPVPYNATLQFDTNPAARPTSLGLIDKYDNNTGEQARYFKCHPFDMLATNLRANPGFITVQDVYQDEIDYTNPVSDTVIQELGPSGNKHSLVHFDLTKAKPSNLTNPADTLNRSSDQKNKLYAVQPGSGGYVATNTLYTDFWNKTAENGYAFKLLIDFSLDTDLPYGFNAVQGFPEDSLSDNKDNKISPIFKLVNLHEYRLNIYNSFDTQELFDAYIRFEAGDIDVGNKTLGISGDCFLTDYSFRTTYYVGVPPDSEGYSDNNFGALKVLYTIFCITTNNGNFRHEGDKDYEKYFPKLNNGNWDRKEFINRPYYEGNHVRYNTDYTSVNDLSPIIPKPLNEDFRSKFKTLIARSEQDNLEKQYEPWRRFAPEDYYKILDQKYGEIQHLSTQGDQLVISMDNATFKTYGQTQINTDSTSAYIGKGDIFRGRPQEIIPTELGYAGSQSSRACISTKYGYIFFDTKQRKLFLLGDGLEEISAKGLQEYFDKNMGLDALEQYNNLVPEPREPGDFDVPEAPAGLGYLIGFDEENERIILTKKDLVIKDQFVGDFIGYFTSEEISGLSAYNFNNGKLLYIDGVLHVVIGNDYEAIGSDLSVTNISGSRVAVAEDRSKTISYSFVSKRWWASFHSYAPSYYATLRNKIYVGNNILTQNTESLFDKTPGEVFILEEGNYGEYFKSKENFEIVVPVRGKGLRNLLQAIYLDTYCIRSGGSYDLETTFDEFRVMNTHQISPVIPLVNMDSMRNIEQYFYINKFRDEKAKNVLLRLQENYEPVGTVVTGGSRWYNRGFFIDQYHLVKFIFKNNENKILYLHGVDFLTKPVRR